MLVKQKYNCIHVYNDSLIFFFFLIFKHVFRKKIKITNTWQRVVDTVAREILKKITYKFNIQILKSYLTTTVFKPKNYKNIEHDVLLSCFQIQQPYLISTKLILVNVKRL